MGKVSVYNVDLAELHQFLFFFDNCLLFTLVTERQYSEYDSSSCCCHYSVSLSNVYQIFAFYLVEAIRVLKMCHKIGSQQRCSRDSLVWSCIELHRLDTYVADRTSRNFLHYHLRRLHLIIISKLLQEFSICFETMSLTSAGSKWVMWWQLSQLTATWSHVIIYMLSFCLGQNWH